MPVNYRDLNGHLRQARARAIDFREPLSNRFLAVRELKIIGLRSPGYHRRADLVCFVNGLPLVFTMGKDYEVITADDRLDTLAADFVEHCATRWESGKSMLVCIDKITCARRCHLRVCK